MSGGRKLLYVLGFWAAVFGYTGYVVGLTFWLGGWALIPALLPVIVAFSIMMWDQI